jgi:competence protein ComEA
MKNVQKMGWIAVVLAVLLMVVLPLQAADTAKVNINVASVDELTQLKRVGAKVAQKIVEYREKNGPFKTPVDITNVPGIGMKVFELNKDSIVIE